ncbi:MAG TPA: ATP-binding cassette domain-containing protein [Acidimicrobiales bacterium]|jgi:ABC-2 type transport system ATP-binding protein|nr:ATP-binding cassette domain-containing protein [Acidimicrobiales bacterium]
MTTLRNAPPAIEVHGLRKAFGDQLVLDNIDLEVGEGTIFALLGPNGSGKTTTVRILSTLLPADAGAMRVAGHDVARQPDAVRKAIGVTGQFSAVDKLLTGRENLTMMADLAHLGRAEGRRRVTELLGRFDLAEAADKTAATFSGGMRRRLDLAMTLVGSPRVIFLDEPTTGLDPRGRHAVWEMVRTLVAADGVTIFLTTQYLDEADQLADHVAVLDRGVLVAQGTPAQLKRRVPGGHIRLEFPDATQLDAAARLLATARRNDETLSLEVPADGSVTAVRSLLVELDRHAIGVEGLSIHTPDLDDVFFAVTGHATAAAPTAATTSAAVPTAGVSAGSAR